MQTGKIRRTVSKLRQLQNDFYAFPAADLTLWFVQRTEDTLGKLPPGLRTANRLYTVKTLTCEYYVTTGNEPDQTLSELNQTFCSLMDRTDSLLKQINLTPGYDRGDILDAVVVLAEQGRIDRAFRYYWQGGTKFAKCTADRMKIPLACLDWFVKVDRLAEAVADAIDELLTSLEPAGDEQQPMPVTIEQPTAKPSEPEGSETYRKLLSAYTNGASDAKLKAMAIVIDGNGTVDEKTEKLNSLLSLSTLSGETIGKLLGCSKQAIFKTRYWKDNRTDEIPKRIESRRTRLSRNGKQYEPGVDDE